MNQPPIEAEIVSEETDKLVKYASQTGLEPTTTDTLVQAFWPVFDKSKKALAECKGVAESVKDATCVTEIRKARACRLALRSIRIEAEGIHKKQKENALRFGRAVDGFRNILLADIGPVEQALQDAEDTAERMEAARKSALQASRQAELRPFLEDPELPIRNDLCDMSEETFAKMLSDAKLLKQAKIDAALKAEAEKKAREEAEQKERARIAAENERLRAELEAKEAAAKAEREAAEKKLADERAAAAKAAKAAEEKAAKERAELEAKAKKEAEKVATENRKLQAELEAKQKAEAAERQKKEAADKAAALAAKKAAAAPDKAKLEAFAGLIEDLQVPRTNDPNIETQLKDRIEKLYEWIIETAQNL